MKTYLISDTHFSHKNIIKYCNRPYADEHDMDYELIKNWNSVVKKGDTVFHLGDVCLDRKYSTIDQWFEKLNGNITVILGQHDKLPEKTQWCKSKVISHRGIYFYLTHMVYQVGSHWL
jgi:calcineurin-like phosphoesterase family protein